jgi:hypothetical protein
MTRKNKNNIPTLEHRNEEEKNVPKKCPQINSPLKKGEYKGVVIYSM